MKFWHPEMFKSSPGHQYQPLDQAQVSSGTHVLTLQPSQTLTSTRILGYDENLKQADSPIRHIKALEQRMNEPLSVFIICQDEERIIESCLRQAAKIADEIVIVDSGSSDSTLEIARRYTSRIYHQDWLGYGRQKNCALSKCSNEWVMSLDADEVLPDELVKEISLLDFQAPAYRIARKLYLGSKFIRWGGYFPDYQLRLFKKSLGRFSNARVHESVKLQVHDRCPKLRTPLNHFAYADLAEMRTAFREFAELSDRKPNLLRALLNFLYTFLNKFLLRFGFLHGYLGFQLAANHAEYSFLKYQGQSLLTPALQQPGKYPRH